MKIIRIIVCFMCFIGIAESQEDYNTKYLGLQKYYSSITKAYKNQKWWDVIYFSNLLLKQYPKSAFSLDTTFFLAEAYFHVEEFHLANKYFSKYLLKEFSPKFYQEAINYKFLIGKKYYEGSKKHLFNSKKMPKILPAKEDAL